MFCFWHTCKLWRRLKLPRGIYDINFGNIYISHENITTGIPVCTGLLLNELLDLFENVEDITYCYSHAICPPVELPGADTDKDYDLSDEEVVGDIEHHTARYCALWWKCGVYNPMMISAIRLTKIRAIHLGLLRRREFKAPNSSCRQLLFGSRWSMSYLQVFLDLNTNIDKFVVNQSDSASSCG